MISLLRTARFDDWLAGLKYKLVKARIAQRLDAASIGHFGDTEPVGEGVFEMRIHIGAGYRVYYARKGSVVYVLLCGGIKRSQDADIKAAKKLWQSLRDDEK